jgi:putative oxidoreductase
MEARMFHTLFHSEAAVPAQSNLVAIILRLSLAATFLLHGLDKIINHDGGADWVNRMYARMPEVTTAKPEGQRTATQIPTSLTFTGTQIAVAWGEFFGGMALALGMLTRLAAFGLMVIQAGAVVLVTYPRGFQLHGGGAEYQYNLVLIVMCLCLLILGPGHWSLDRRLAQRRTKKSPSPSVSVPTPAPFPELAPSMPVEHMAPGASS